MQKKPSNSVLKMNLHMNPLNLTEFGNSSLHMVPQTATSEKKMEPIRNNVSNTRNQRMNRTSHDFHKRGRKSMFDSTHYTSSNIQKSKELPEISNTSQFFLQKNIKKAFMDKRPQVSPNRYPVSTATSFIPIDQMLNPTDFGISYKDIAEMGKVLTEGNDKQLRQKPNREVDSNVLEQWINETLQDNLFL